MKQASKKKARKITEDGDGPPPVKRTADGLDTAYFIAEATLNEQPEPTSPAPDEEPPAPAAVPPRPLARLAALWPDPAPSLGATKSSQAPAQQVQKALAKATAPPAPASLLPKPPFQSMSPTAPVKAAASAQVTKPTPPKTISISFTLVKPDAEHVSLTGEFNDWSPDATAMKRQEDGHWETMVALAPGRHQYKFVVDGQWITDPVAHENVRNPLGTLNSVIEVRA